MDGAFHPLASSGGTLQNRTSLELALGCTAHGPIECYCTIVTKCRFCTSGLDPQGTRPPAVWHHTLPKHHLSATQPHSQYTSQQFAGALQKLHEALCSVYQVDQQT